ncbi:hypothetical protein GCK72_021743 [Caenorhabditis remanei]|uniref:F-box domain-containing protein n=1 Tax=Caenorhabditis remanei TaxID=31234 RepID=A0A6A5GKD6_CAERE|nr:hypothetical protein GCK72_021743 [Caenorhabditis remanei]KAF1755174.1 hypothetical protein GCK72_021743 [Caenorhabditis remanei]
MRDWNHLPVEIKRHVVKNLDFMSRHSMKSTSHVERLIVNSTCFKVPRVRFGYKQGKCLVMIYTGIEKFLRLELSKCKEGILVERSENTWDPRDITTKILPPSDVLKTGLTILKNLLAHESIIIEAMEWDIPDESPKIKYRQEILATLDNEKFRVRELVFLWNTVVLEPLIPNLCVVDDFKLLRRFGLEISGDSLVPVMIHDSQVEHPWTLGRPCYQSMFCLNGSLPITLVMHFQDRDLLLSDPKTIATVLRVASPLPQKPDRQAHSDTINWTYGNECGYWTAKMIPANEAKVKKMLDPEKCGVHYQCKNCTDPFTFWYHQNLARRFHQEPFWGDIVWQIPGFGDVEMGIRNLKIELAKDEKKKEKMKKWEKEKSWGFKEILVEKCDFKGLGQESEEVKDSGDAFYDKNFDIDAEEQPENMTIPSPTSTFSLKFFFILPILLSFMFYLIISHLYY